jgi:hypothetical protein
MKEQIMQNKKLVFIMGILILIVGAVAFIAGRMLNGKVSPLGLFGLRGGGDVMSVRVSVIPAEELPKTRAEVVGLFVERQDNTIIVSSIPMKGGDVGVAVGAPADMTGGPEVEVVVTNETTIYRETTDLSGLPPGEHESIQQTVEESTLDDLNSQSMVMVWGRKSGDRIIAEVLFYSNPVMFKRP